MKLIILTLFVAVALLNVRESCGNPLIMEQTVQKSYSAEQQQAASGMTSNIVKTPSGLESQSSTFSESSASTASGSQFSDNFIATGK